jgi:hypothetical protein
MEASRLSPIYPVLWTEVYGPFSGVTKLQMASLTFGESKSGLGFIKVKRLPVPLRSIEFGPEKTFQPSKGLSAFAMPLSHGTHHQNTPYESSGFFIENDATNKTLLVFGDIEPDSVSGLSLNRSVWTVAAQRISEGRLSSMLIECSYCVSRTLSYQEYVEILSDNMLFVLR